MKKPNEDDILETTLSIAEKGYPEAYRFLLNAYEESPSSFGPQTFYFLACLAGGANMLDLALAWLRKAIQENSWWYRPEVLEDDDFAALKNDAAFLSMRLPFPSQRRFFHGRRKWQTTCFWPFMGTHKTVTSHGQIGNRLWEQAACGSWKPSRVPNRTAMEPIVGAMTALPICR